MNDGLQWHRAIPGKLISSNEVHVWRVCLDLAIPEMGNLQELLSADELERAGRFRFASDQQGFIAARGMLRTILGHYLGMSAGNIRFEYTASGKPILSGEAGRDTLHFNLSHSGGCALYAVTRGGNIGIDIERVRDDLAVGQIADRFFSPGEISSLTRIHTGRQPELFFRYWTRKEAFIKAIGEGISFPLEQCDVSLINGDGLWPVILATDRNESSPWYVQDLYPGPGYAAAMAVEGGDWNISYWQYPL